MAGATQFRYAVKMNVAFITSRLQEYFEAHSRGVVCVYVFGSVARGTARGRSDIDVAVLLERDPLPTLAQLAQLECRSHIFREAGVNGIIDLHCM